MSENPMRESGVHPFGALFVTVVTVIACMMLSLVAIENVKEIVQDVASYHWVQVQGVVINKGSRSRRNYKGALDVVDFIGYEYALGDRKYSGEISYSRPIRGTKYGVGNNYELGDDIDIYYDPLSPEHSKYETGLEAGSLLLFLVINVFASYMIYMTTLLWSQVSWRDRVSEKEYLEDGRTTRPYRNIGAITLIISIGMIAAEIFR